MRLLPICTALLLTPVYLPGGPARAQRPEPPGGADAAKRVGSINCSPCHAGRHGNEEEIKKFIRYDEYSTWKDQDIHKRALEGLSSPLGRQMSRLLWRDETAALSQASCLTCHAVDKSPGLSLGTKGKDIAQHFYVKPSEGNSCEVCHGFASKWLGPHLVIDEEKKVGLLRLESPERKQELGLVDLRNPQTRAERCAGCHVGNAAEGKFVTHEMYAAGHPPLPPFEIVAFTRDQPRHFETSDKLPYFAEFVRERKDEKLAWELFHYRPGELQQVRYLAAGALVTARAAVRSLADEPKLYADAAERGVDFAHFDCYACHHDLKPDSWRQKRGFAGAPGRPQFRSGVVPLLKIVLRHAATCSGGTAKPSTAKLKLVEQGFAQLTCELSRTPFGEPVQVRRIAGELDVALRDALAELEHVRYTREEARRLLDGIADYVRARPKDPNEFWIDPESAQHLVWAVESIRAELEQEDGPLARTFVKYKDQFPPRYVRAVTRPPELLAGLWPNRLARINSFELEPFRQLFVDLVESNRPPKK